MFLVDDHDLVRRGLRDMLAAHRDIYVMGDSGSARRAIELVRVMKPDVVVIDLRLQDGSGVGVSRAVRSAGSGSRCLLLTSAGDDEALMATLLGGAAGYAVKLARSDYVLTAIRRVGAGRNLLDEDLSARAAQLVSQAAESTDPALSEHERGLLAHVLEGLTDDVIAERLGRDEALVADEIDHVTSRLLLAGRGGAGD